MARQWRTAVGWVQQIGSKWQARKIVQSDGTTPPAEVRVSEFEAMAVVQQGWPQRLQWEETTTPGQPRIYTAYTNDLIPT